MKIQRLEGVLIATGLAILATSCIALSHRTIALKAKTTQFSTEEATELNQMAYSVLVPGSDSIVDFRLWSSKKIGPIEAWLLKKLHVSPAILRIQRNELDVPIASGTDDLALIHAVGRNWGVPRAGEAGNLGVAGPRDGFVQGLQAEELGNIGELKLRHRHSVHSEFTSAMRTNKRISNATGSVNVQGEEK